MKLAWSERYYDLVSTLEPEERFSSSEREELGAAVSAIEWSHATLRRDLTPAEVSALEPVISGGVRVRIAPRNERIVIDSAAVRAGIGAAELEFDSALAGNPGRFRVLLGLPPLDSG